MSFLEENGHLYEFLVLSEAHSDCIAVECCDLGPEDKGLIGTMRVAPDGRGVLELHAPIAVPVLCHWLDFAEAEARLAPPRIV